MEQELYNETIAPDALTAELMGRMGATQQVADCCGLVVTAQNNGDICLGPLDETLCQELEKSPVVTQAPLTEPRPFVLENRHLYTRRNWLYKQTLQQRIHAMAKHDLGQINVPDDGIFAGMAERQREGVDIMCRYQLSILTGGPGTGKTFTIARAVKLIGEKYPDLRLGLAAPTGKAAARVKEAMEKAAEDIGMKQALPTSTIHALLRPNFDLVTFKHNHANPLPLDWLIIDEASMIDLPLMAKLLDALSTDARLTLVGDANQLASVEPGRVFGDLCRLDSVHKCELNESRRFPQGGAIATLADAVNNGDSAKALAVLKQPGSCVHYTQLPTRHHATLCPGFEALVKEKFAAFAEQTTPEGALAKLNDCRILCALRNGPYGIQQLNAQIHKLLGNKSPIPMMILRNDRDLGVSNGDVGVILKDNDEQTQLYLNTEDGSLRAIPLVLLPNTEMAFASTIHKSQGSEYSDVIIILPPTPQAKPEAAPNPLLTRELLYTAITRTQHDVFVFGGDSTIQCCCEKAITRNTGGLADASEAQRIVE